MSKNIQSMVVSLPSLFPSSLIDVPALKLEYVNRHRLLKHLGIRPWSCACGVSYARSDLLCRHKRKCPQAMGETELRVVAPPPSNMPNSVVYVPPAHCPSLVEPSARSDIHQVDLHAGARPPSYDQAVGYNPAPHISNEVWVQLPTQSPPTGPSNAYDYHHRPSAQGRVSNAPKEIEDFALPVHSHANVLPTHGNPLQPVSEEVEAYEPPQESSSEQVLQISHPASQVIRYSDPTFFITEEPISSPYYLNPNLWVLAFLCQRGQGFTIPTVGTLSRYMRKATVDMLSLLPMIHVPTLKASVMSIHLGYALCVAGAATDATEHGIAFANQSLLYKRPLVQRDFETEKNPFDFRFELLQTLLTYQFLGMYNRLDHQRQRAVNFNDTLVQNFRNLELTRIVQAAPDYVKLVLEGQMPLELAWRSWAKYETHKRTIFLVLMSAYQLSESPGLMAQDADVPLPCHEEAWNAPDAESWLVAMYRHTSKCLTDGKPAIGEESLPSLTDALAALSLGPAACPTPAALASVQCNLTGSSTALPPSCQNGLLPLTPPQIRQLGSFANVVLSHCEKMSNKNPQFAGTLIPTLKE
ncbi:hypothetical protein CROQUDRAFT_86836 [Cronartium quercuum f. sp. fusiforme G11]|uniref:Uncharacterized protein n=1 Tax=Cronartium quercuum f. sp. fusiforme G11 TaxID=708437 RepID=A0A9P6TGF7_9BASI|nr:hypothetical protein CROQUDRAFT_86836 [Cronartium quercuum f. sp. fusiforme G11]